NTDFTSTLSSGKLTVTVGDLGAKYKAVLEEGKGVTDFVKDTVNFHTDDSLSPEKQLVLSELNLLVHMDENTSTFVSDSSGNWGDGTFVNSPTWTDGIVRTGLEFESSNSEGVTFGDIMEGSGEPFSDTSTQFTVTAWLYPNDISHTANTNHGTQNCFMAKASDPRNDNFEIGINTDGTIHVYIDAEQDDTQADFGQAGDIVQGEWSFVALRYDNGDVDVRINDNWYTSTAWSGSTDLDQAEGSPFTIGFSDHINVYYDGKIDEVAVYNTSLTNEEIENYKYGSETSKIESITQLEVGDVFSQYEVNWTESFDMHVSDICTFYYDYSLWNVNRSIYFDEEFDGLTSESQMYALNTYYDLSGLSQTENFDYIYDGKYIEGLNNDGFLSENYTIIHDEIHPPKYAFGIFIPTYETSGSPLGSVTTFKGEVNYNEGDEEVKILSGSENDFQNNIGGSDYILNIEYWEYIDTIDLNQSEMVQCFDNILGSLRTSMDFHVYEKDSKFYNLKINVTDIDGNEVPAATVKIWNKTDPATYWTQKTESDGTTLFTRLNAGMYSSNVTYQKYGKDLTSITSTKDIYLNESTVDTTGLNITYFENVHLTSLNLTFNRFNSTGDYQERLEGAAITFWQNDGTGDQLVGTQNTDVNGNLIFRWANVSSSGNVTFSINWFENDPIDVDASLDLGPSDDLNVTYYFNQSYSIEVNATFGPSYETNLEIIDFPDETEMLGEELSFLVNYTKIENATLETPISGANVEMILKRSGIPVNNIPLEFTETATPGIYSYSINTNNTIEGKEWFSSVSYTFEITASKSGHIPQTESESFTLRDRTSSLTKNETSIGAYWQEYLTIEVTYTDTSYGQNNPLNDANVECTVPAVPTIFRELTYIPGSDGKYLLQLDTTDFPSSGTYTLQITANQQNYQEKTVFVEATISNIKTLINNSLTIYRTYQLQYQEAQIFNFNYTIASSGEGLGGSTAYYEWIKQKDGEDVASGTLPLTDNLNGIYTLDFQTSTKEIATYIFSVHIEADNYAQRDATIVLEIVERQFDVDLPTDKFSNGIIQAVSGQSLTFTIEISDELDGYLMNGTETYLILQGNRYDGNLVGTGLYSFVITDLPSAFFMPIPLNGKIYVNASNYEISETTITVNVGMTEIFPGFPMFYFLLIVIGVVAIVGALATYRYIQIARIPEFVKRARAMKKEIKGGKSISDKNLYPSKDEFITEMYGEDWEKLGL
ncbi:MAG: LamG domain-containing protein, partial [Promethearchaeota archaeon]